MNFLLLTPDHAERVNTSVVSVNFFEVLGVRPLLGRTFQPSDDRPDADAVLILSYKYWQNRHGGDRNVVGKVFEMNNRPHTVIGVLPPIPQYPAENDVYMPTWQCPFRSAPAFIANRQSRMMTTFGRLKEGSSVEQAQSEMSTIAGQLRESYPEVYPASLGYRLDVASLQQDLTARAQAAFLVLLGAAGFVLLIACANIANLLLARLLKVERELALRMALGAGRGRLIRQLLTESLLLAVAGGLIGLALAPVTLRLLVQFAERFTARAAEIRIDTPVLLFAFALSIGTSLLFGLGPASVASRNLIQGIRQAGVRIAGNRMSRVFRSGLVVAQVAVTFVLLIAAGLMVRSLVRMQQQTPGFQPDRLLTLRMSPNATKYTTPESMASLRERVLEAVRTLGLVEGAAIASSFPFNRDGIEMGPASVGFQIEGTSAADPNLNPRVDAMRVSEGYFETLRQPLVRGRTFTARDDAAGPRVAVINESMARHRWPNDDPIGKRVRSGPAAPWTEIVGIVRDVKEYGWTRPVGDQVYAPVAQVGTFAQNLVLRTSGDPAALAPAVREALRNLDPQLAVDRVETVAYLERESTASSRVMTLLIGLFAGLAALISACGIAAVMTLAVNERTNELGVRMALGASRPALIWMVVRQGFTMAVLGIVAGGVGAVFVTRLLGGLLYEVRPADPVTFTATVILFLAVAAVSCLVPARRVTAIDPLIALRQD